MKIQPRARHDEFAGLQEDRLRIRLTAPPVDGKANAALIAFLAREFKVARSAVAILKGETGRLKTVSIQSPGLLPAGLSGASA